MADEYIHQLDTISSIAGGDYICIADLDDANDLKKVTVATLKTFLNASYTAGRALKTDGSGNIVVSDITSTELDYLDGLTENVQDALNAVPANLNDLSDVNTSSPVDGNIIVSDTNEWTDISIDAFKVNYEVADYDYVASAISTHAAIAAAHTRGLSTLTNCSNVQDVDGHIIYNDTGQWKDGTPATAGITALTTFNVHKTRHQNGGSDEISVAGLSGELADNQKPKSHTIASHSTDVAYTDMNSGYVTTTVHIIEAGGNQYAYKFQRGVLTSRTYES